MQMGYRERVFWMARTSEGEGLNLLVERARGREGRGMGSGRVVGLQGLEQSGMVVVRVVLTGVGFDSMGETW
jgi:hypothetical protein